MKRVPWGAQRLPGVARQDEGRGRGKEGREGKRGRNEEEGSEVRQRELAACKICKAKTKSETETETVNWDWVAWQQRSKQREERGRGRKGRVLAFRITQLIRARCCF